MIQAKTTNVKGRNEAGRFTAHNKFGKGNPHCRRLGELRAVLLGRLSDEDMREIIDRLVKQAKAGDIVAAKVLLKYLGDPRRFHDGNVAAIPPAPRRIRAGDPLLDRMVAGLA